MTIKKIIFYDNNPNHFTNKEQYPYIECIEVLSRQIPVRATNISLKNYLSNLEYNRYKFNFYNLFYPCKFNGAQVYALCINKYLQKKFNEYDYIDISSGITEAQINTLIYRINKKSTVGTISMVVFDFDRTLTKVEGFPLISFLGILHHIPEIVNKILKDKKYVHEFIPDTYLEDFLVISNKLTLKDVAEYYFGGRNRVKKLQRLWNNLSKKKIIIKIVTCNSNRNNIKLLMNAVNLKIKSCDIIIKSKNSFQSKLDIISFI